jgi:hypothetical protein
MNQPFNLKTAVVAVTNWIVHTTAGCGFIVVSLTLAGLAFSPTAQAQSCPSLCDTFGNTAEGLNALKDPTMGTDNTAIGNNALFNNTTGSSNTATGDAALIFNTTGGANTATGAGALNRNGGGSNNTANGFQALFSNTSDNNTATGYQALSSNSAGSGNTATGVAALQHNNVDGNTAMGYQALFSNTTGGATATGYQALFSNTTGHFNTATGAFTLLSNTTGNSNTAMGDGALGSNTSGGNNTATGDSALGGNTIGNNNTATGSNALNNNTTGNANTATGYLTLLNNTASNNTATGYQALLNNTSGGNNIALGNLAGHNLTTGSNNIDIGNQGVGGESAKIRIGKQGTQTGTFIAGIYNISEPATTSVIKPVYINSNGQLGTAAPASSQRFKEQVRPMDKSSEAILALKPVTFKYKKDSEGTPQFGLIAEQVEKVAPDLVVHDEGGKPYTVRYEAVNAMLLNEFLKAHREAQQLKATVAQQQKQIEALTAAVQKVSDKVELNAAADHRSVAGD